MRRFVFPEYHRVIAVQDDSHKRPIIDVYTVHDPRNQFFTRLCRILCFSAGVPIGPEVLQQISRLGQVIVIYRAQRLNFALELAPPGGVVLLVQKSLFPGVLNAFHRLLKLGDALQVLGVSASCSHCVFDPVDHAIWNLERGERLDQLLVEFVDPNVALPARLVAALGSPASVVAGLLARKIRRAHRPVALIGEIRWFPGRTAQTENAITENVRLHLALRLLGSMCRCTHFLTAVKERVGDDGRMLALKPLRAPAFGRSPLPKRTAVDRVGVSNSTGVDSILKQFSNELLVHGRPPLTQLPHQRPLVQISRDIKIAVVAAGVEPECTAHQRGLTRIHVQARRPHFGRSLCGHQIVTKRGNAAIEVSTHRSLVLTALGFAAQVA